MKKAYRPLSADHPARLAMVEDYARALLILDDPGLPGDPELELYDGAWALFQEAFREHRPDLSARTVERHFDKFIAEAYRRKREIGRLMGPDYIVGEA